MHTPRPGNIPQKHDRSYLHYANSLQADLSPPGWLEEAISSLICGACDIEASCV